MAYFSAPAKPDDATEVVTTPIAPRWAFTIAGRCGRVNERLTSVIKCVTQTSTPADAL